ncbi:hypothetical protein PAXRUDRAFT_152932 [Paxillus rubicundulus Ve08.2h10]|uniref:DUF6570 domain-containing protein n=1 Tax=Paxillus rubicundulus Ve08.2h10 TaxID=930991 RepID=A0A0D0DNW4_9AGAM|nr:hypothetical protein PAXRUDRAFT_152932 [Paxillus rubicundulus Ve08.2h10]
MLLYKPTVFQRDGELCGNICHDCLSDLMSNKLPKFALANNMWIGNIPQELSILSLPERILVSLYYPAAYVVKLYPKRKGAIHWDPRSLNYGVHSNVSTYHLNTSDVAKMVDGQLLPPTPRILTATIGVTIIGPKNLPERCMPSMLIVSQHRVRCALQFLKHENPLYHNTTIQ